MESAGQRATEHGFQMLTISHNDYNQSQRVVQIRNRSLVPRGTISVIPKNFLATPATLTKPTLQDQRDMLAPSSPIYCQRNILPPVKRGEVCCSRNNSVSFLGTEFVLL